MTKIYWFWQRTVLNTPWWRRGYDTSDTHVPWSRFWTRPDEEGVMTRWSISRNRRLCSEHALMKKGLWPLISPDMSIYFKFWTRPDEEGVMTFQCIQHSVNLSSEHALMKKGLWRLQIVVFLFLACSEHALMKKGLWPGHPGVPRPFYVLNTPWWRRGYDKAAELNNGLVRSEHALMKKGLWQRGPSLRGD